MTQILDADDTFTENSPHYGGWVTGYMRFNPWETAGSTGESATGYLLRSDRICDLHSGYFGTPTPPGSLDTISPTASAWKSNLASTASGGDRVLCSALWRPYFAADCTVSLTFQLHMLAGAALSDSFRHAGVCVRASGSPTYVDTAGSERVEDGDSYWLLLCNNGSLGYKWKLLRVNAGAVTQLATQDITTISLDRPHTMSLDVETSGGNVILHAHSSKLSGSVSLIGGRTPVELFGGPVTDSSGSKITASGRCGFGAFQDHQQSSGAVKSVTLISAFEITDTTSGDVVHRDEFVRGSVYQLASLAADGNGAIGRNLMCGWTTGLFGVNARAMQRDSGNNRVTVTSAPVADSYSTRPATNPYAPWRSAIFNILNPSSNPTAFGINLRGSWLTSAVISGNRYLFKVWHCQVASSGLWTAQLIFVNTAGVQTVLCSNSDLTAFSLALNATITLEMRVRNIGGPDETTGTPEITTLINSTAVPWTNLVGVSVQLQADESVLHVALGASGPWSGSVNGVHLSPGSGATVRFDTWTSLSSVSGTTSTPVDEMASIAVSSETDGATGTLDFPYDWGVEVIPTWRQTRTRYESEHVAASLLATRKRRMWRVSADACTDSERTTMLAFWDAHGGMDLPFSWVEPNGTTVTARFWTEDLGAVLRDVGVTSFKFDLLEMFS